MTGGDLAIFLTPLLALVAFIEMLAIITLRGQVRTLQRDYDKMHEAANQATVAAKEIQAQYATALRMRR